MYTLLMDVCVGSWDTNQLTGYLGLITMYMSSERQTAAGICGDGTEESVKKKKKLATKATSS